jgi:HrpA-like RNA helicase
MSIVPCDVCVCEFSMDRDPWAKFRRPNSEHPAQSEETRTHQHPGVAGARRPNAMPSPSPAPPPVLPISEHEDEIVAAVDANPVVVVIGETGSGKSTQLSQILHRRGYTRRGAIAVTQPRRVAAVSVSRFFVSLSFLLYHMREALFFSVGRSWAVRRDWDWNCLYIL